MPLTPLDAHHPSDHFGINYKSVRQKLTSQSHFLKLFNNVIALTTDAPVSKHQRKLVSQVNLKLNPAKISNAPEDSRYDDPQTIDKAPEVFNQSATRQKSRS